MYRKPHPESGVMKWAEQPLDEYDVIEEIVGGPDRVAAILGHTWVDKRFSDALAHHLGGPDQTEYKSLFNPGRPLWPAPGLDDTDLSESGSALELHRA